MRKIIELGDRSGVTYCRFKSLRNWGFSINEGGWPANLSMSSDGLIYVFIRLLERDFRFVWVSRGFKAKYWNPISDAINQS